MSLIIGTKKIHNFKRNSNYQIIIIYAIGFILLFLCDISNQKKVLNNNYSIDDKQKNDKLLNNHKYDSVQTGYFDSESNKYETANYNFCPLPCSCLGDYFECKKKNLTKVPKLPAWVRSLELTGNRLDNEIEQTIGNLTELITLNLKKNRLQGIPVFKGLIALQKLNLSYNKIQALTTEALLSLPNLRDLDLSKNQIRTILPHSFPTRNILNSLNLNHNRISILEDSVFNPLTNLTELNLGHNNLSTLPNGIFKSLQSLKKLDLSNNSLDISWSVFKGLNELKVLKLRSNGIQNLPDGVFHALKSLSILELDSNRITHLNRQGFYNLTNLQILSLSSNLIDRIEIDTWEFTQNLVSLDLSYNNLTEIRSHHLDCLHYLKILNFGHNKIQHISDNTFECTKSLEQLDISYNKLSWTIEDTSGVFKSLKNLQKLDLSRNDVKSINQKAFYGLENLKVLNLEFNNLTSMQFNAFESLKKLENISLNSDHFLCDCNIQWFYSWLKASSQISRYVTVRCDYPIHLRAKILQSLKEDDFMCNESPKPRLIKEPTNQLAIKGTNVKLECSAVSSLPSEMHIQWKRDNFDVHGSEIETKFNETNNNSSIITSFLHLQNVSHEHTGKYQCIVTNSFGTTYSQKFKITVATYPGFKKVPSNVTLNSGSTARLDCSAYGEPTPQIAWQKDGGNDFPAARERRMHVMPADDAFFIINAKISDMGIYTCTAENPAGIIKANATLIVYEPPAFVKPMESKEVTQGTSTVLECMSSGSPKPALNWYKDSKPLKLTDRHFFAAESQLLIIVDVKLIDAGIYRCEMKNELGTVSGNSTLKINKMMSTNVINVEELTGIVIITVFCCAVGTSVIWVVIIYQTKKGNTYNANNYNRNNGGNNNSNNINGGSLLNQVTNSAGNIENYIQAATVAAANLNDETMHHLIVESNNSSQPSQVLIMSHLNNGNENNRNEFVCSNNISSLNHTTTLSSIPVVDEKDSLSSASSSLSSTALDKSKTPLIDPDMVTILIDSNSKIHTNSSRNRDNTNKENTNDNDKNLKKNKDNLLYDNGNCSSISTKTIFNCHPKLSINSNNNNNNSNSCNSDNINDTLSSSLYKNKNHKNDNHTDSNNYNSTSNSNDRSIRNLSNGSFLSNCNNISTSNSTNSDGRNSNSSGSSSNNSSSSGSSNSSSSSSNNSENEINQLSVPLLIENQEYCTDNINLSNKNNIVNNSISSSFLTQDNNISDSTAPMITNNSENDDNNRNSTIIIAATITKSTENNLDNFIREIS